MARHLCHAENLCALQKHVSLCISFKPIKCCNTLGRKHTSDLPCNFLTLVMIEIILAKDCSKQCRFQVQVSFASGWHCEINMRAAAERKNKRHAKKKTRQENNCLKSNTYDMFTGFMGF